MRPPAIVAAIAVFALLAGAAKAQDSDESQMGAQLYKEMVAQREVVATTPLYQVLKPIADAISRAAEPRYHAPIHFYIVHSSEPNAFAAPGGNIYVIDSLMYFVHNREELAGTLCHETSHLIHHDSVKELDNDEAIRERELIGMILLGPSVGTAVAASAVGKLDSMHFSREAEESADLTGADTCAAAGLNPWGLVWLFRDFSSANMKTPPEILSDHPNNQHRIEALEAHFKSDPARFARFSSDPKTATALRLPRNEAEAFLK